MEKEFDFGSIKKKALEQLKSGKSLLGKDGAFAPLLENILNAALEGRWMLISTNRNAYQAIVAMDIPQQVQTPLGEVTYHTPRDRESTFEPEFIAKRERILADGVTYRIIGLYAMGNSVRQISD